MRRIGGHVSSSGGPLTAVKKTQEIGGNCIQLFAGSPRMWRRSLYSQEKADEFRQQIQKFDFGPVYIHALYLTNLASDQADLRGKSKKALVTDLDNAALIGSDGVVLHIGSHQGRGFDSSKQMVKQEIQEVLDQTPEESNLLLENTAGQKGKIGSLRDMAYFIEALDNPRVKICIDTAHAFAAGHDSRTPQGLDKFIHEIEHTVTISRVDLLHLNDSRVEFDSHRDIHENLGDGYIGLDGLGLIVNHPKLKHLPLILEVPGFDPTKPKGPDRENIEIAKSLLRS